MSGYLHTVRLLLELRFSQSEFVLKLDKIREHSVRFSNSIVKRIVIGGKRITGLYQSDGTVILRFIYGNGI